MNKFLFGLVTYLVAFSSYASAAGSWVGSGGDTLAYVPVTELETGMESYYPAIDSQLLHISTASEWASFWELHNGCTQGSSVDCPSLPAVDFGQENILVLLHWNAADSLAAFIRLCTLYNDRSGGIRLSAISKMAGTITGCGGDKDCTVSYPYPTVAFQILKTSVLELPVSWTVGGQCVSGGN